MAILNLDLIPYSSQNQPTTVEPIEARSGYGLQVIPDNVQPNLTFIHIEPTRSSSSSPKPSQTERSRISVKKSTQKKVLVKRRKLSSPSRNDTAKSAKKKRASKSDLQLLPMQLYTQPLSFDISYHPPIFESYNPLQTGVLNTMSYAQPLYTTPAYFSIIPTIEPVPYKTLPVSHLNANFLTNAQPHPQFYRPMNLNWNHLNSVVATEKPPQPLPAAAALYNPYAYKRKPAPPYRFGKQPPHPGSKYYPIRTPPQVPYAPPSTTSPATVTHIFKYEESNPGLRLPFDNGGEDHFVENFPAISVALQEHFNDRVSEHDPPVKNYMTPPKFTNEPYNYEMPTMGLTPPYQNDFDVLDKFNEGLRSQNMHIMDEEQDAPSPEEESEAPTEYEEEEEEEQQQENEQPEEDKNYSDSDVKKAIQYIRHLKKDKASKPAANRGSKKFNPIKADEDETYKKRKPSKPVYVAESSNEVEDNDGRKKRKKGKNKAHSYEEDEEAYKMKSEEELSEEESNKESIKADKDDNAHYQESQIVPALNEQLNSAPDFIQQMNLNNDNNGEDRVEFQMHGLRGPDSYKFGYDTGKGENRQFRYEEKDPDGKVKGHFGYYDKDGKLQVFNYEADPEHGYHLEQATR